MLILGLVVSTRLILVILLIVLAIGLIPYGGVRGWGYWPGGGLLGAILLIVLVLYLLKLL